MSLVYCGELTIGGAVPGANACAIAGYAGINAALPDITEKLAALLAFVPTPVDFQLQLQLAQQMVASVQASITLGLPVPSIAAQIAIVTALIADLTASVVSISAQLGIITDFQALLGAAGVHVYAYAGPANGLGGEVTTALATGLPGGAPTDATNALVLATTVPATWTAMAQVFQVVP
jgi:hypothetical protein